MRFFDLGVMACMSMLALPAASARSPLPVQYEERLPPADIDRLVAAPILHVREGDIDQALAMMEAMVVRSTSPLHKADLVEAFGVALYVESISDPEPRLPTLALAYLKRAIEDYRTALSVDDPEVATALNSYADAYKMIHPDDPSDEVGQALRETYRIRKVAFGDRAPITLSTLSNLAEIESSPQRLKEDARAKARAEKTLKDITQATRNAADADSAGVWLSSQDRLVRLNLRAGDFAGAAAAYLELRNHQGHLEDPAVGCFTRLTVAGEMERVFGLAGRAGQLNTLLKQAPPPAVRRCLTVAGERGAETN